MSERWRYRCVACGGVSLSPRTRLGGVRCETCGHIDDRRVDAKSGEVVSA